MAYSPIEQAYLDKIINTLAPDVEPEPEQMVADSGQVTSDAPGIVPIPQTRFEKIAEQTGMTLEQIGNELDKLGKVKIGSIELGIRDFLPFVGSMEDGKVTGTPAALQAVGRGESLITGTGMTTQLKPDAKLMALDVATAGVAKPAMSAAKATVKGVAKALPKDLPVGMSIKMIDGTEEVVKQAPKIETPEFKNWFGKSKVVDVDGKPMVLYHGTDQNFDEFQGTSWFTTSKSDASNYSEIITPGKERTPNVMPVYVSMKKPKVIDSYATRDEVEAAKQSGKYDGVIVKGVMGSEKNYYITFKPEQVKSVFNRGTFDPKDPNILRGAGAGTAGATATQEENK